MTPPWDVWRRCRDLCGTSGSRKVLKKSSTGVIPGCGRSLRARDP
jgi:hypothetical protein